jgi:hypothetical protein
MRCLTAIDKVARRSIYLPKLLQPLIPLKQRLTCRPKTVARNNIILGVHLGSEPSESDPDLIRFATRVPTIRAAYYERWLPMDSDLRMYYLERAYLHLYLRQGTDNEKEIIALHCDPNEPQTTPHYRYKAGPHLHMSTAPDPLPHCHIALNNADMQTVLGSLANLTDALQLAITMINDQVLERY